MKRIASILTLAILGACGGGGGGGESPNGNASGNAGPTPPSTPAITSINARQAFTTLMETERTVSLASNDGFLGTANLIIRSEQNYPFVSNGMSSDVARTVVIQFQRLAASGVMLGQSQWKLHLDANMQPVGLGYATNNGTFKDCVSVTGRNELPTSATTSGTLFAGQASTTYAETWRSGTYAHYCDTSAGYPSGVEWSVVAGAPNPYFCLTLPLGISDLRTRICTPVDSSGKQSASQWVRLLQSDGTVNVDYKDTSANRPVEQFSTTINAKSYWYGAVWRPLDGYVYQSYPNTKFSSEQACREQTVINWKQTWNATNIGWTCIHVTSN